MRAVVLRAVDDGPRLEDVAVDAPETGEILVRIAASGICGSDLHVLHGASLAAVLPAVLGHEGAGVVEAVGPDVGSVAVGDRVVLTGGVGIGARLHVDGEVVTPYVGQGTMAEYAVLPETNVAVVPDDVPLDVMALTGCGVLTGVGTVLNGPHPDPGGTALVVGCGGVGLNVIQALRLVGAEIVIAIDNNPIRLEGAADFGATHRFHSGDVDIVEAVRSVVPAGVDVAYEVVGAPELTETAWKATRPGGTCVMVGAAAPGSTIRIDSRELLVSQRTLTAVLMGGAPAQTEIPRIIDLYRAGRLELDRLVGERFPLHEFERAIAAMEAGTIARALLVMDP